MKTTFKNIKITHMSCYTPENQVDINEHVIGFSKDELESISRVTGIKSVTIADKNETSVDLALKSAKQIPSEVIKNCDAIIFVSQTRDYLLPQSSFIIQKELDLKENTYCLDIPVGCSGYIYGLIQAYMLISTNACKQVLVLTSDTNSKIINRKDKSCSTIFGDAATATVVESGNFNSSVILKSDGSNFDKLIVNAGNGGFRNINIDYNIEILREDGNVRKESEIYMDGLSVMNFAINNVPSIYKEFLEAEEHNENPYDFLVLHQANKFMLDYLTKRMKLPSSKVPICIDGYGNTGPSSIPLLLVKKNNELNFNVNNNVLISGFGVGLSWGIMNINLKETKFY